MGGFQGQEYRSVELGSARDERRKGCPFKKRAGATKAAGDFQHLPTLPFHHRGAGQRDLARYSGRGPFIQMEGRILLHVGIVGR